LLLLSFHSTDPSTSQIVTREYQPQLALKYGCNPQQQPAGVFSLKGQGLPFEVINGQPGYINLLDAVNSWCLVSELCAVLGGDIPVAASFKHCSPSGVALGIPLTNEEHAMYEITPIMSAEEALTPTAIAYLRARNSDPMCSYGDFAALSHPVDEATARQFQTAVCDGVIAPGYTPEALAILTKKKKGAFIVLQSRPDFVFDQVEYRELSGVVLSQARNSTLVNQEHLQNIVCARGIAGSDQNAMKELNEPLLSVDATRDLLLATTTVKYTQSNSVAYALGGQVIGVGAGQQSRVDCVKLAGRKVSTWFLRRHPKVMGLPFKEGVKRQDRINARVRFIEGDITAAEMPLWRDHFTATPEPLGEDEKRSFLEEGLRGVSIASDGFFPFRCGDINLELFQFAYCLTVSLQRLHRPRL
jgi:phosphoribosylaminoimidazolecarboxamide formyltransferase/IMP cyclohydrolase